MAQVRFQMPAFRTATSVLIALMIAVSVMVRVVPSLAPYIVFIPSSVLTVPWSVLTYGFVATDPVGVIFGALILYSIGGQLETVWGTRRFVLFSIGATALAAVATALVALVWSTAREVPYPGSSVMTGALWVAYGLWVGPRQANFWGLPMTGNQLAALGAFFVALNAIFSHPILMLPSAFALLFAYLASRGYTPANAWLRFRSWSLSRQLARRSNHLKVVSGDKRNMPNDSDRFLH